MMHIAVIYQKIECLKVLIDYGGDMTIQNIYGMVPFQFIDESVGEQIKDYINQTHIIKEPDN
jgi:ankyrin repeat protein